MNIGSVAIFEGPAPPFESVRTFVAAKLRLVPRCRQRVRTVARNFVRPVWVDDVNFALGDHLHHASLPSRAPRALEQFVEEVMPRRLDRDRALWEMWVVEGFDDDRWAIVSKVHHCMVDGIAGTDLLAVMMDEVAGGAIVLPDGWTPAPEPSRIEMARFTIAAILRSARAHARHLIAMLRHGRRTGNHLRDLAAGAKGLWLQPRRSPSPLTGPIGLHRRWAHTRVSLAEVATIRHAFGGTVNDVVLTVIARGFRDLLRARGETLEGRSVMALVPVSTRARDEHGRLDNRVAVTHALLPVDIDDPVANHAAVRRHLDEVKVSHETDTSTVLLHSGDATPHAVAGLVARFVVRVQRNLETIATNVPGPRDPLYLCGRRMLEAYPFAPIAGRIRIAIAIWSYCGTLHVGVTGDRDGASDLDALVDGIERGFEELRQQAIATTTREPAPAS